MPRNSEDPQFGHQEAARFERECPLGFSGRVYEQQRRARYPGVPFGELPPESMAAKGRYEVDKRRNDDTSSRYHNVQNQEKRTVNEMEDVQRQYYNHHSDGIRPAGHSRLVPLARNLSDREFDHARTREAALKAHPLMYVTAKSKIDHHKHVQDYYHRSDWAKSQEQKHIKYSTARPSSHARDLYGNEPPNAWQASSEPYPPHFPDQGYYFTTRGEEIASDGGGWTEAGRSSGRSSGGRGRRMNTGR